VDLVKVFDTMNHDLLCQILLRYGLPPVLVQNIKKRYNNCTVKIKVGEEFTEIDYTTGVHKGDNMSPVLFLFVMQTFLETLQFESQPIQYSCFPKNKNIVLFFLSLCITNLAEAVTNPLHPLFLPPYTYCTHCRTLDTNN
jgi:hypothetical protein